MEDDLTALLNALALLAADGPAIEKLAKAQADNLLAHLVQYHSILLGLNEAKTLTTVELLEIVDQIEAQLFTLVRRAGLLAD